MMVTSSYRREGRGEERENKVGKRRCLQQHQLQVLLKVTSVSHPEEPCERGAVTTSV